MIINYIVFKKLIEIYFQSDLLNVITKFVWGEYLIIFSILLVDEKDIKEHYLFHV